MQEHLSRELLRAISQGWRNPGDLATIALAHLFELCPHCRREYEVWRADVKEGATPEVAGDYDTVVDRIRTFLPESGGGDSAVDQEQRDARSRAEQLLLLPPEQRADWIRSEAEKHSGLLMAEALIEECRRRTPGDPHESVQLANLARLVLQHAPTSLHATELYARALARLANAIRVIGDLPRADQILGDARYFLGAQGGGDRLVRAELDRLESSLRLDQARAEEAVPLLLRSLMTYRLDGVSSGAAASLIQLANAHRELGDLRLSLTLLRDAEKELEPGAEPWLVLLSRYNAAPNLLRQGEPERAHEVLAETQALSEAMGDPVLLLRRSRHEAEIAWALGDPCTAETQFLAARDGFARRGLRFDEALVGLDLAHLYAEEARSPEAAELVEMATPVFQQLSLSATLQRAQVLRERVARQ